MLRSTDPNMPLRLSPLLSLICLLQCAAVPAFALSSSSSSSTVSANGSTSPASPTPTTAVHQRRRVPWLIIGGGIHGVHVATRLLGEGVVKDDNDKNDNNNLLIIDPASSLLSQWKQRTAATGMEYLRSSAGYHLDVKEDSLRRFASSSKTSSSSSSSRPTTRKSTSRRRTTERNDSSSSSSLLMLFSKDYERPRLDFFNQHCDAVIAKYGLDDKHIQGVVTHLEPHDDYIQVSYQQQQQQQQQQQTPCVTLSSSTTSSTATKKQQQQQTQQEEVIIMADQVVLALGNDEPAYPEWVTKDLLKSGMVRHLLDTETNNNNNNSDQSPSDDDDDSLVSVAIIGGGITAAHKALQLVQQQQQQRQQQQLRNINSNSDTTTRTQPAATASIPPPPPPPPSIHLLSRQESIIEQQFDTHQDWMMDQAAAQRSLAGGGKGLPKRQRDFCALTSWKERRQCILRERIPGTVTAAVNRGTNGLQYAIYNNNQNNNNKNNNKSQIQWHPNAQVTNVSVMKRRISPHDDNNNGYNNDNNNNNNKMTCILQLSSGETIEVDRILMATGFGKKPPSFVSSLPLSKISSEYNDGKSDNRKNNNDNDDNHHHQSFSFPVSDFCGYPIVDSSLRWGHDRIFVTGALAELELGPSARNIAGARLAAERIVKQAASSSSLS